MTMLHILLAVAALLLFVKCSRKFGFRKTLGFAALIVTMIFPFTISAGLALPFFRSLWHSSSTGARIVAVLTAIIGGYVAVKKRGAGNVLGWTFSFLVGACFVILAGFVFVLLLAVAHGAH
jgi:hypothetical protein